MEETTKERWIPKPGERFFYVNATGTVSQDFCRRDDEGNKIQLKRQAVGNEFRTGKEAELAAEKIRKVFASIHNTALDLKNEYIATSNIE